MLSRKLSIRDTSLQMKHRSKPLELEWWNQTLNQQQQEELSLFPRILTQLGGMRMGGL